MTVGQKLYTRDRFGKLEPDEVIVEKISPKTVFVRVQPRGWKQRLTLGPGRFSYNAVAHSSSGPYFETPREVLEHRLANLRLALVRNRKMVADTERDIEALEAVLGLDNSGNTE